MAEPQPPAVHEGAAPPPAPAAASEAAALSSLDNKTLSSETSTTLKKEIDLKALNDAMKALESGSGSKNAAAVAVGGVKKGAEPGHVQVVKVDVGDVMLLAEQLDISKPKATELLRAHDSDAVRAMKAWVTASV